MPQGIGAGPAAMGTLTGRRAGNCAGSQDRCKAKTVAGKNAAGRGKCGWFNASDLAGSSAQETEGKLLMEQADDLRKQLDEIDCRMSELKKKS